MQVVVKCKDYCAALGRDDPGAFAFPCEIGVLRAEIPARIICMDMDESLTAAWGSVKWLMPPYSKFAVGAALGAADDRIFRGCNVENLSYGLTECAERTAICAAVAAGVREFDLLVVVADTAVPISPCGACRQVMAEFDVPRVILANRPERLEFSLEQL